MFPKAVEILLRSMSKQELLKLHEEWNADPHLSFFHEFEERLSKVAPEIFD